MTNISLMVHNILAGSFILKCFTGLVGCFRQSFVAVAVAKACDVGRASGIHLFFVNFIYREPTIKSAYYSKGMEGLSGVFGHIADAIAKHVLPVWDQSMLYHTYCLYVDEKQEVRLRLFGVSLTSCALMACVLFMLRGRTVMALAMAVCGLIGLILAMAGGLLVHVLKSSYLANMIAELLK